MPGSGFWMAIFVAVVTLLLPVFSTVLRKNQYILSGYWLVIIFHQIAAFSNRFFFRLPGVGDDSLGLHRTAERLFRYDEWHAVFGARVYTETLALIYRQFGVSLLLGYELSILAFAISCIFLIKIMNQLGIIRHQLFSLLFFGSLPSMVIMGSVTLRESFEILFFMLTVYFGIKVHLKGGINANLIGFFLSGLLMASLHAILPIYAIFLIGLILVWPLRSVTRSWNITKIQLFGLGIVSVVIVSGAFLNNLQYNFDRKLNLLKIEMFINNLPDAIRIQRGNVIQSRSSYGGNLEYHSYPALFYSFFFIYIHYLFGPFPWQAGGNMLDIYACMESFLRMGLIFFAVKQWRDAPGFQRQSLGLLLVIYFSITLMWSMGTSSYGTALRHHMMSYWILAIAGVPPLIDKLTSLYARLGAEKA